MKKSASTFLFTGLMLFFIAGSLYAWFTRPGGVSFRDPSTLQSTLRERNFLEGFSSQVLGAPETADRLHHIAKKIEFSEKLEKLDHDFLEALARKVKNGKISGNLLSISEKY